MDHQLRVHTLNLLCHQAVLQCPAGVGFVAEGHRSQFHQARARAAHVVDVALIARCV